MKEFIINKNDSEQRLDKFLCKSMPKLPKGMMFKLIRKKDIKINGKRCDASDIVKENDRISVYAKDEFCTEKQFAPPSVSSEMPEVVYEDENILIVNKPSGLAVHCDNDKTSDTLISRVIAYLILKNEYDPKSESSFTPALCNRLDKNTEGLVIAAKNSLALREINEAIREHKIQKTYICVTVNAPPKKSDTIYAFHKKSDDENIVKIIDTYQPDYKEIITQYKVLRSENNLHLVEVTLITGRTHQIRAHLSHIGAPILGDSKYGNVEANRKYMCRYQALCAYKIQFQFDDDSVLHYLNEVKPSCNIPSKILKYFKNL